MHYHHKESLDSHNPVSFVGMWLNRELLLYACIFFFSLLVSACGGSSKPTIIQYNTSSNLKPYFISTASQVAFANRVFKYYAKAQDHDTQDHLKYSLFSSPPGMKINSTSGRITWVPTESQLGPQFVIVKAMDNGSPPRAGYQSFGLVVQLPSAEKGDTSLLDAQDDFIGTKINNQVNIPVLANDHSQQSPIQLSIISQTIHGRVQILNDKTVLYTPDKSYRGDDQFIYEITDGTFTDTATVTISVGCSDCHREKVIDLRWDASVTGLNAGYLVYYGENEYNIDRLAADLSNQTGLDEEAPAVRLSAKFDLGLTDSSRVCFQISAYVASVESELSAPICAVL